jgi:hypothetical protein
LDTISILLIATSVLILAVLAVFFICPTSQNRFRRNRNTEQKRTRKDKWNARPEKSSRKQSLHSKYPSASVYISDGNVALSLPNLFQAAGQHFAPPRIQSVEE